MIHRMRELASLGAVAWLLANVAAHAAAADALEAPVTYVVQPNDTLIGLGAKLLTHPSDYMAVQQLNGIKRPRRLRVGFNLVIPYALLRAQPMQATLVAYRGAVTVTANGAPVPVRPNMMLGEGYALTTGPDAFLTLEFEDGSRTTLPSRSQLTIQRLRKLELTGAIDRILTLQAGRSDSTVTPLAGPKDRFVVTTPLAVAAVRGTQFRVAYDDQTAHSLLEVIEGKVGSTSADQTEVLAPAGFGLVTSQGQAPHLAALLKAPKLQNPGKVQEDPQIAFAIDPVPEAKTYRAQLASDGGFVDLIAEVVSPTTALPFGALPDGDYFVRFTALDENGLEGSPATYAVERRLNTFGAQAPAAVDGPGRRYRFRWNTAGAGVASFRFQLATAPEATPIVDEPGLTDSQIVVTDLPPGVYYWRVLVTRTQNGKSSERWSAPERFEIAN